MQGLRAFSSGGSVLAMIIAKENKNLLPKYQMLLNTFGTKVLEKYFLIEELPIENVIDPLFSYFKNKITIYLYLTFFQRNYDS